MKKTFRIISIIVVSILAIILVGNSLIRVSDGSGKGIGIFEEIFLGKSIYSFLQPPWSENYLRWNKATEGSKIIAEMIAKHGKSLIENEEIENIRLEAVEIANSAYLDAKNIDLEYLRKSNDELPEMFSTKLTYALQLWSEGLKEKDNNKIIMGIQFYNEFLQWIQSRDRDDFNRMR